jgi:hypothetical protein
MARGRGPGYNKVPQDVAERNRNFFIAVGYYSIFPVLRDAKEYYDASDRRVFIMPKNLSDIKEHVRAVFNSSVLIAYDKVHTLSAQGMRVVEPRDDHWTSDKVIKAVSLFKNGLMVIDGKILDEESFEFVANMRGRGVDIIVYYSDIKEITPLMLEPANQLMVCENKSEINNDLFDFSQIIFGTKLFFHYLVAQKLADSFTGQTQCVRINLIDNRVSADEESVVNSAKFLADKFPGLIELGLQPELIAEIAMGRVKLEKQNQ